MVIIQNEMSLLNVRYVRLLDIATAFGTPKEIDLYMKHIHKRHRQRQADIDIVDQNQLRK